MYYTLPYEYEYELGFHPTISSASSRRASSDLWSGIYGRGNSVQYCTVLVLRVLPVRVLPVLVRVPGLSIIPYVRFMKPAVQ